MKKEKVKELLFEQLRKTPIAQIACEKTGVARSSYYRWKKNDKEFAKMAEEALQEGIFLMCDLSETQLFNLIKDGNLGAITFLLKHRHPAYRNKVEINANINQVDEKLSPEQKTIIRKALRLASLSKPVKK